MAPAGAPADGVTVSIRWLVALTTGRLLVIFPQAQQQHRAEHAAVTAVTM